MWRRDLLQVGPFAVIYETKVRGCWRSGRPGRRDTAKSGAAMYPVRRTLFVAMVAAATMPVAGFPQAPRPQTKNDAPAIGKRGPGMKGPDTASLKLPVPRTFDLTHVEAEHFAAALGKDPEKIFAFVRDHIADEAYPGCL